MSWMDALGLVAGILVAVSLVMKSMRWLRPINLVGCSLFVVWGLLAGAAGVWICNGVGGTCEHLSDVRGAKRL